MRRERGRHKPGFLGWVGTLLKSGTSWRHALYAVLAFPWSVFSFCVAVHLLDGRLDDGDVSAVALGPADLGRAAGHPAVRGRARQRLVPRLALRDHGDHGDRGAARAGHAVDRPRAGGGGPADGRRAARAVAAGHAGARAGVGPGCRWWTPRRPTCGVSNAICTTAHRPGSSPSPWTSGSPRKNSSKTPTPPQKWSTRPTARSRLALQELRDLARGIHPAILTDRGLGRRAVGGGGPLHGAGHRRRWTCRPGPRRPSRASPTSRSSELLTKRQQAQRRPPGLRRRLALHGPAPAPGRRRRARAAPSAERGSGLAGLAERLDAVDGVLLLESPPGGPTRITAELPWRAP